MASGARQDPCVALLFDTAVILFGVIYFLWAGPLSKAGDVCLLHGCRSNCLAEAAVTGSRTVDMPRGGVNCRLEYITRRTARPIPGKMVGWRWSGVLFIFCITAARGSHRETILKAYQWAFVSNPGMFDVRVIEQARDEEKEGVRLNV